MSFEVDEKGSYRSVFMVVEELLGIILFFYELYVDVMVIFDNFVVNKW